MSAKIVLIIVISLINSICYTFTEKIGNYSNILHNYNSCGVSKSTLIDDTNCFEYHRGRVSDDIKNGRPTMLGEAPWIVHLKGTVKKFWFIKLLESGCGGTLIGEEWVLTTAHCVEKMEAHDITVSTSHESTEGYDHFVTKIILHDKFVDSAEEKYKYDIALLKLKRRINNENDKEYKEHLSACLPPRDLKTKSQGELANMAGFGSDEPHLRIATVKGDSGTGIWMHEMGRAVVIGVHQRGAGDGCDKNIGAGVAVYVPHFIDWILDNIKNN